MVGVVGSNPIAPTNIMNGIRHLAWSRFLLAAAFWLPFDQVRDVVIRVATPVQRRTRA